MTGDLGLGDKEPEVPAAARVPKADSPRRLSELSLGATEAAPLDGSTIGPFGDSQASSSQQPKRPAPPVIETSSVLCSCSGPGGPPGKCSPVSLDGLQEFLQRCCGRTNGKVVFGHVTKFFCIQANVSANLNGQDVGKDHTLVVELIEHADEVEEDFSAMGTPGAGRGSVYRHAPPTPTSRLRPYALVPEAARGTNGAHSNGSPFAGSIHIGNLGSLLGAASEVFGGQAESAWSSREAAAANMAHAATFESMLDGRFAEDKAMAKGTSQVAHTGATEAKGLKTPEALAKPSRQPAVREPSPDASSSALVHPRDVAMNISREEPRYEFDGRLSRASDPSAVEEIPEERDASEEENSVASNSVVRVALPEERPVEGVSPTRDTPLADPQPLPADDAPQVRDPPPTNQPPPLPDDMKPVRADPLNSEAPPPMAPPSSMQADLPGELSSNGLMHLISALKNSSRNSAAPKEKQLRIALPEEDEDQKPAKGEGVMWNLLPDMKSTRRTAGERKARRHSTGGVPSRSAGAPPGSSRGGARGSSSSPLGFRDDYY